MIVCHFLNQLAFKEILTKRLLTRPLCISLLFCLVTSVAPANFFQTGFVQIVSSQSASDDALASARRLDSVDRNARGGFSQLPAAENLRRGNIYLSNRAFTEAREHFQTIVQSNPNDVNVPAALFGIGRSFFVPRRYAESLPFFERLARDYSFTKEGREGLYALATAFLRMSRADEAVERYIEYTRKFPQGERAEASYLNVIDGLREAGRNSEAIDWIARTRQKFPGTATDTNALFARLRLEISESDWSHAIESAGELRGIAFQTGVVTSADEVAYLRAYALERAGRSSEAINAYLSIPDSVESYYGALATKHLTALSAARQRSDVAARISRVNSQIASSSQLYPVPYREMLLRATRASRLDPRLVLSIMRRESNFRPSAKSPAGARGLLQLTIDQALKYATQAGIQNLREDDLYNPDTSIRIGSAYLSELTKLFTDSLEAVAASYNGGEDNVARWLKRAHQQDAGVFVADIGFPETKTYVFKILANYRAYKLLYTEDLRRSS
ncbi:MAG TPA: transglycosylase SLT domain-containing protein [Pyrinomonadaceae bacterium]|nr:transglycosylase SLT domain-containing protein [Pyrinomonadaceae bacterium]